MRKKLLLLLILAVFVIVLGVGGWYIFFKRNMAALLVETLPNSQVFINGEQVGVTPYETELKAEEVTIKLVPETYEEPLLPYETKVKLTAGVKTIVRREFGGVEGEFSGEEISFERVGGKSASVSVVSKPDAAQVFLDGQFKDIAPVKINDVSEGEHRVEVKAEGYEERAFEVKAVSGYNLTAIVELKKKEGVDILPTELEGEVEGTSSEEDRESNEIEILQTPTGYLRVRKEASTQSPEVGRAEPGKKYKLLEDKSDEGWYKIEYETGKEGWVSSEYASSSATVASEE